MDEHDNIDTQQFGEKPEIDEKKEEVSSSQAVQSAAMIIGLYSSMVPPFLYNMVKNDVSKFRKVLDTNTHIPYSEIEKLEKFLNSNNQEIEKALQLSKEQVVLLKHALAEVLKRYNIQPTNPWVNLLIVVLGIAVTQFMTVREIIRNQNEQITRFIMNFKVTVPEGVENPLVRKTKLIFKKKKTETQVKEAA